MNMKYYGAKAKCQKARRDYVFAKAYTKAKSILPGFHRDFYKRNYEMSFKEENPFSQRSPNSIPEGHFYHLDRFVTSDLIHRENIKNLQAGIRQLLREHRAGDRFLGQPIENLEEICEKIDQMDSTLLSWVDNYDCGVFDFRNEYLESDIDHFIVNIQNINASFLSMEFHVFLTEQKRAELDSIINLNYEDNQKYVRKTLVSRKHGGALDLYTRVYYSDEARKAKVIKEWINRIEWDFYDTLKRYFPFVLHNSGIMPPRIEAYLTGIDYREDCGAFWSSVGLSRWEGQFIDERQKMFFPEKRNFDKSDVDDANRLIYVIKDDGIPAGQMKSVKDEEYIHLRFFSKDYFIFMFLDILSRNVGKTIVRRKHKIDKIKLKKNQLKKVLKQRYLFERDIDTYMKYVRDDIWQHSIDRLEKEVYGGILELLRKTHAKPFTSYLGFCLGILSGREKIDESVDMMRREYDSKERILQHLSDYTNSKKNWILSCIMLFVTAATLFFTVFPGRASWLANKLRELYRALQTFWNSII